MKALLATTSVLICCLFAISGIKAMNMPAFVTAILVTVMVVLFVWFMVMAISKGDRKNPSSEMAFLGLIKSFGRK